MGRCFWALFAPPYPMKNKISDLEGECFAPLNYEWCHCAASTAKCVECRSKVSEMLVEILDFLKSLVLGLRTSDLI